MQTPFEKNYFELFSIEKSYSIDTARLRERFREMQKMFHPDRFATATQQDRRISAQYASLINEAFTTLNDPVQRGRYMLSLAGVADEEHDTSMAPAFLMEQIELREELDMARSDSLEALARLNERIDDEFQKRQAQIAEILDGEKSDESESARNLVRELQFLDRIKNEIEEAEESFF